MLDWLTTRWGQFRPSRKIDTSNGLFDSSGRLRVSQDLTLFDSKLSSGKLALYWDELLVGTGSATHSDLNACVDLAVEADGDIAINQTIQRWNYQPGKSQHIVCTCKFDTSPGISMLVGPCHGDYDAPHEVHDGIFFKMTDGVMTANIVKGSEVTGIATVTSIPQSAWNHDRLDGTGPSGRTVDWTKVQRVSFTYLWHGVGPVSFWVDVDDVTLCVHEEIHTNISENVYMSNATQPVRYEIRSTGGAGSFKHICTSVSSEGGSTKTGVPLNIDMDGVFTNCPAGVTTMLFAVQLDPATPDAQILIEKITTMNKANNSYRWVLLYEPTIGGAIPANYVAVPNSPLKVWRNTGAQEITLTGGYTLDADYASAASKQSSITTDPTISLGVRANGTPVTIALGIEAIDVNAASCVGGIKFNPLV